MKKFKSINEVIIKGQFMVNVPVTIIGFAVPIIMTIGIPQIVPEKHEGIGILVGLFGGMILGFFLAWTWWSFSITKWRIWAFNNTQKSEWNTLRRKAVKGKLIWEDGHQFERTEIRSTEEQQKIENINSEIRASFKTDTLDQIEDDPSIPNRINYYYKKSEIILSPIVPLVFIGLGIFLIISDNLIIALLGIGMGIYMIDFNKIKNLGKKEAQFHISNEGIYIKKFEPFGFIKWEDTQDVTVDTEDGILKFYVWEEESPSTIIFNLNEYQIGNYDEFLRIINVYLKRSL